MRRRLRVGRRSPDVHPTLVRGNPAGDEREGVGRAPGTSVGRVQFLAIEAQPGFLQMHVSSLPNAGRYGVACGWACVDSVKRASLN